MLINEGGEGLCYSMGGGGILYRSIGKGRGTISIDHFPEMMHWIGGIRYQSIGIMRLYGRWGRGIARSILDGDTVGGRGTVSINRYSRGIL